jgi:hypothetical protein
MNERIKQILLQVVPMAGEDGEYLPSLHTPEDIEKFAMLIVEECRNVLTDVYREVPLECSGHLLYADEVLAKHFYGINNNIIRSE